MERKDIEQKVLKLIEDQIGEEVTDTSADLQEDYKIDSIATLDFIMSVEDEFDVQFDDDELENMHTVDDVINRIEQLLQ